jgi:hypothetical protein
MSKSIISKVIKKVAKKMEFSISGELKGVVENFEHVELDRERLGKDFENEIKKEFEVDSVDIESDAYFIRKVYITRLAYSIIGDKDDLNLEIEPQELEYNFELEYSPNYSKEDKKTFKGSKTLKINKKFTIELYKCYDGNIDLPTLQIYKDGYEFKVY